MKLPICSKIEPEATPNLKQLECKAVHPFKTMFGDIVIVPLLMKLEVELTRNMKSLTALPTTNNDEAAFVKVTPFIKIPSEETEDNCFGGLESLSANKGDDTRRALKKLERLIRRGSLLCTGILPTTFTI